MNDMTLAAALRAVRLRRGLRQLDLATLARVSRATISLVERGHWQCLSIETVRRIAAVLDVRIDCVARWRGGDLDRLLSRRHSALAEQVAGLLQAHSGWIVVPEVSFAIYGERGVIDQLGWHEAAAHLLVLELKTEFVDINAALGTLDRKVRLARTIAAERGWGPKLVSVWLIVSDTRTNRRHAAEHSTLLGTRFKMDGRQLRAYLRNPSAATTGLAFMTNANPHNAAQTHRRADIAIGPGSGQDGSSRVKKTAT
ncbi:MAG TPA: helix-turn-helix transcriptional regulator [Candidatus Limnocylindrales bacterium]